jgi:hypothetical protein
MPTSQQAAQELLSLFVAAGARPGRSFSVNVGKPVTELHTVPNNGSLAVDGASAWVWDGGVSYAGGAALAAVSASPAQGQYAVSGGVYQFNVADALAQVEVTYRFGDLSTARFPGQLQASFLQAGYGLGDLVNGLAYAIAQGWLSTISAPTDANQGYTLEPAGFAEAGGAAPAIAASAQRLINVAAALNDAPGAARFDASTLVGSFVGVSGGNTFAPEDVMPGYGQALASGWVRPCGQNLFAPVFVLTAAGVAAAS